MQQQELARVIVVGGGIAGLVAANAAADRLGPEVTLLDTGPGRARTSTRDGVLLNEGPHALYLHGALAAALRGWGIDLQGGSPDLGDYWAVYGDRVTRSAHERARSGRHPAARCPRQNRVRQVADATGQDRPGGSARTQRDRLAGRPA